MTALASAPARARLGPGGRASAEAALLAVGLGAVVAVRAIATRVGVDPILVGTAFGAGLLALVVSGGRQLRIAGIRGKHLGIGLATGFGLVAVALAGASAGEPSIPAGLARPASPFVPWAVVTVVVAAAEEAILRGLLFGRIRMAGGTLVALLLTSAVFALMHVPLYGWHVVPLDLAVGLVLGGLRIATRGVAAAAVAHALADLATWWL
jgi:membrane protease YdiL (CAAX protease family)